MRMRHVNYMWSNYFHSYCDFIHCVQYTVQYITSIALYCIDFTRLGQHRGAR